MVREEALEKVWEEWWAEELMLAIMFGFCLRIMWKCPCAIVLRTYLYVETMPMHMQGSLVRERKELQDENEKLVSRCRMCSVDYRTGGTDGEFYQRISVSHNWELTRSPTWNGGSSIPCQRLGSQSSQIVYVGLLRILLELGVFNTPTRTTHAVLNISC